MSPLSKARHVGALQIIQIPRKSRGELGWRQNRIWLATICNSENARRLLAIPELRDDVAFCLQRDIYPLIAKMEADGAIRTG